jgi:hypothetical protein
MNGMDDNEDEHNFSDDGFDALEDTALEELEHNAILSTQQARAQTTKRPVRYPVLPQPTRITAPLSRSEFQPRANSARPILRDDSTLRDEYDDDSLEWIGDDRVPTPVEEVPAFMPQKKPPGETTQREQWRNQRFGRPLAQAQPQPQPVYRPQHSNYQQSRQVNGAYNGYHAPQPDHNQYQLPSLSNLSPRIYPHRIM